MSRFLALAIMTACTVGPDGPGSRPSPEPPPTWGVPISGGNLLVTRDGTRAVIADPDRDRILVVELATDKVSERTLAAGAEPGRLVEDGDGRVHVALRGTGELLTLGDGEPLVRRVCAEPRGLAWDPSSNLVHVACTTGELVSMPAAAGVATRTVQLDRDLRDVVVSGSQLVITRFRSAEILTVDAQGVVAARVRPPIVHRSQPQTTDVLPPPLDAVPTVAWRTIALPDGRIVVTHQRKIDRDLATTSHGYLADDRCGQGPIESAISVVTPGGAAFASAPNIRGALPIDVAVDPGGTQLAFVLAGGKTVQIVPTEALATPDDEHCGTGNLLIVVRTLVDELGAPTSVAFRPDGELLVFYPELPALVVHSTVTGEDKPRTIRLPGAVGYDSGRALFHTQTSAGIACASCHPEGREDGQTWTFADLGPRRTQNVAGAILARAPYHWVGDMADLPTLMETVFVSRMGGDSLTRSQRLSLGPWLDRLNPPAPRPTVNTSAVMRGQALFLSAELACLDCHVGPLYTNNALANVGTGGMFKVPSLLGLGARAPFIHDGCAATLGDLFTACGAVDAHGRTSQLTDGQRADLVAFLESL